MGDNQGVNASGGHVLENGGRVRRRRLTPIVRRLAQCWRVNHVGAQNPNIWATDDAIRWNVNMERWFGLAALSK